MCNNNSVTTTIIDPVTDSAWRDFVHRHVDSSIFHHPNWLRLIHEQYRFEIFALCLWKDNRIIGGIPFCRTRSLSFKERWICLPFSDYCGPLVDSADDLKAVVNEIRSRAERKGVSVEIRNALDSSLELCSKKDHWLHVADLDKQPAELLRKFRSNTRSRIKKAQENGLKYEVRRDKEAMNIFYGLHLKTRRKQGVPIQPRSYFQQFYKHIIEQNLGFISVTSTNTQNVSAAIFCGLNETLVYKYGASDPVHLSLHPNYHLFWETILYAKRRGFTRLDFGKTSFSNSGLRQFKRGWNVSEEELAYTYYPHVPSSTMFDTLDRLFVRPVIKHSPTFVCRISGEILYKYLAA